MARRAAALADDVVAEGVVRIVCPNPGPMTLQGTNVYFVGEGPTRIMVDAGQECDGYRDALVGARDRLGIQRVQCVLITHRHHDHVGAVRLVRDVFGNNTPVLKHLADKTEQLPIDDIDRLCDGQVIESTCGRYRLSCIYAPGHTSDHMCFALTPGNILFSGDCILGGDSTAVFDDLTRYMESLMALAAREPAFQVICPGHGSIVHNPRVKIQHYIEHRLARDRQILDSLSGNGALSCDDIQRIIYGDTSGQLQSAARLVLQQHLRRLVHLGNLCENGPDLYSLPTDSQ
ncbi:unnamed protein product (mitochondrion) [Plasmodiophora brassicae]|uniref:Metallo-beta-lactamase domain-containing protein n=1 Tax=Plasmodiophora brassicae TaxID=37360 RepID=A0A0G4IME4_PLABS|nr:hypothetical protein PBRA_004995 [Plasmodiophora brassicae]SPQ99263.1 unnamed protein product [Plasmodiophora brassicae]